MEFPAPGLAANTPLRLPPAPRVPASPDAEAEAEVDVEVDVEADADAAPGPAFFVARQRASFSFRESPSMSMVPLYLLSWRSLCVKTSVAFAAAAGGFSSVGVPSLVGSYGSAKRRWWTANGHFFSLYIIKASFRFSERVPVPPYP